MDEKKKKQEEKNEKKQEDKEKQEEKPYGVTEAPDNIPGNEKGNLKIIME